MDVTNNLPLRLHAAGWTAAVAAIPAFAFPWFIAGPSGFGEWVGWLGVAHAPVLTGMVLVAAGMSGYLLCWPLLDRGRYYSGVSAAGIGAAACLLAYFLLSCMVVAAAFPLVAGDLARYPLAMAWVLVGAVLVVWGTCLQLTGWLMVPLAAIVGLLISLERREGGPGW